MSTIIGIDFGNESSFVAVVRGGGIETVDNDYSLRATPSYVAFGERNRILGVGAKNQQVTNLQNTVFGFKRLLGRNFDDPTVQEFTNKVPFRICPAFDEPAGNVAAAVNVKYLGAEEKFLPEQITAMLLTKLKETTVASLQATVKDCVVAVPSYFTDLERRTLLRACEISGLSVLTLMNETTAVALNYGIYKQDLPVAGAPSRNVVFIDFGHSALQVSVCAFNEGHFKVIATAADPFLGGRNFDEVLVNHFIAEFKECYGIDVSTNHRAYIRLTTEVEKLKKQMSANSTKLQLSIECLMDEKDVSGSLARGDFEQMAKELFKRFELTLAKCITDSGLSETEIHSVEIVGGSTRIPAVKTIIQNVCKKPASTTLNQDEAVSRGCALQCAILSPMCKVRSFTFTDLQNYPISLYWVKESGVKQCAEMFPVKQQIPFTKTVSLYRLEPIEIKAAYAGPVPISTPEIGTYQIDQIKPAADGEASKVKIRVKINSSGIFCLLGATLYEKVPVEPEVPMDTNTNEAELGPDNGSTASSASLDGNPAPTPTGTEHSVVTAAETGASILYKFRSLQELPVTINGTENSDYERMFASESNMVAQDKQEMDRIDSKNALEEFIYEMRSKLEKELRQFASDEERIKFLNTARDTEEWLYSEGELQQKQAYFQRLDQLKVLISDIRERHKESNLRPEAFDVVGKYLETIGQVIKEFNDADPKYNHIPDDDKSKVSKAWQSMVNWFNSTTEQVKSLASHVTSPVNTSEIYGKLNSFKQMVEPTICTPQPDETKEEKTTEASDAPTSKAEPELKPEDPMDVKDSPEDFEVIPEVACKIEVD